MSTRTVLSSALKRAGKLASTTVAAALYLAAVIVAAALDWPLLGVAVLGLCAIGVGVGVRYGDRP